MRIINQAKKWTALSLFMAVVVLFTVRLGTDLHQVSASMINRPLPAFYAYDLENMLQVYNKDSFLGKVTVLHIWSSWCHDCEQDTRLLLSLATDKRIHFIGLNYLDNREKAMDWLRIYGNPYAGVIFDSTGHLAYQLGAYAVPETYLIDRKGLVRYKIAGTLTQDRWERKLEPLIALYQE